MYVPPRDNRDVVLGVYTSSKSTRIPLCPINVYTKKSASTYTYVRRYISVQRPHRSARPTRDPLLFICKCKNGTRIPRRILLPNLHGSEREDKSRMEEKEVEKEQVGKSKRKRNRGRKEAEDLIQFCDKKRNKWNETPGRSSE